MRLPFAILVVFLVTDVRGQLGNTGNNNLNSNLPVFARVDATGLTGNGTGIRGVTFTNLTQNTTAIVQSFFAAGGVDPQPNRPTPGAAPSALATLVNNGTKRPTDYRVQLANERWRLVQVIENKRREGQPTGRETAQIMAIERAIQHADQQASLWRLKVPASRAAFESSR